MAQGKVHQSVMAGHLTRFPKEKPLLRPLLEFFDVTWGDRQRRFGSDFSVYFLKPLDQAAEILGFERELLLIYSPYPTFEPRVVQIADDVLQRNPARGRVEQMCFVLVAPVSSLRDDIGRHLLEASQSRMVIPFVEGELTGGVGPWFIRNRFSESLFARDLFDIEQALVADAYFFGRQSFVLDLLDRFKRGENTGLFGLRKSGKTSAIFKLKRMVSADGSGALVYVDAQSPDVYRLRWWELLGRIKDDFAKELGEMLPHPLDRPFSPNTAVKRFAQAVDYLLGKPNDRNPRVLFVLDEIEHICPQLSPDAHWNEDFLPFWKHLRAIQTADRRLSFLIAGVNAHATELPSIGTQDNPLFSLVGSRYMPPFDRTETGEMVRTLGKYMGMHFTDDALDYLAQHYGGHPLLIRLACSWEHKQIAAHRTPRPTDVSRASLTGDEERRDQELIPYTKHVLEVLRTWYPEEFDLLKALAMGDRQTFREYAEELPECVQHLRAYGLVDTTGEPRITMRVVELYMRSRQSNSVAQQSRRERNPETTLEENDWLALVQDISRLRNRFEPKLRRFVKMVLISHLGPERWIDPVLDAVPTERRKRLQGIDRDQILNSELLFSDLINLMQREWERFKHLEAGAPSNRVTRAQLNVLLEYVNTHREDAHAKQVSQAEAAGVAIACAALEDALKRYLS